MSWEADLDRLLDRSLLWAYVGDPKSVTEESLLETRLLFSEENHEVLISRDMYVAIL